MDITEAVEESTNDLPPSEKARITRSLKKIEGSVEKKLKKLQETIDNYSSKLDELESKEQDLSRREETILEVEEELRKPRSRAKEILSDLEEFATEVNGDHFNEGLKKKAEEAYETILQLREKLRDLADTADDAREVLYGVEVDAHDKGEIAKLIAARLQFEALIDQSSSFLGKVTTASLSNDFNASRKSYGFLSMFAWIFAAIPLSALGWIAYESLKNGISVPEGMSMLEFAAIRTLLALPLLALSGFSASVAFRWDRLAAEYRHKHSVAKSFEGYKKVVEELYKDGSDNGMLQKLYDKALDAFGHNPNSSPDAAEEFGKSVTNELSRIKDALLAK